MIGDKDWNWGMTMETQIEELLAEVKRLREVLVNVYWMTGGVATVDMSKTTKDILNYLSAHVHIDEEIEVNE